MRILITEDNGELAEFIQEALSLEGFLSDIARSAGEMKFYLQESSYAAIVLDLGLPDIDGIDVLKSLRRDGNVVPVLILTARGGVQDRIEGLNYGADDYLIKPFVIDELVARLRALLRRPTSLSNTELSNKNVKLDTISKAVIVNDKNVVLGKTEFSILEHFMWNVGFTVSKESLEDIAYQDGESITENALQVAVHRVRKKLEEAGSNSIITTIRGVGYLFK
ncbi:response regulator [Pseudoalteromonas denitrificans]|uniref:DNA-binding response regulator, OmpR family, contains REC and winged-helix (WHTH) domain n=1 Tax=Pseudoalteromonas denitrificans DSM 6059 TaxID=1123010 RepID=A0A1I1NZ83_9GAMM|nr:response regulator transcription factor [Pseudoalteromonas denitrificans]SFC99010.1 DNA-binding response regulator, OmpR family, contains REC and winged-helix (wHTH) domain [Pseudoalteromonas denitrificans DSM 6059]